MITEPFELKYLYGKAGQEGIPLAATFELTSRCNLDCKMCYIHGKTVQKDKELSTAEWKKIIDTAAVYGTVFVLLTGGEPLLRSDFRELYLYCIKKGMLVSVNTNGTLIDKSTAEFFKEYPPLRLNISFYGASEKTYENLCGNGKMCNKAKDAILTLKNMNLPVKLNLTVSEYNCDDIPAIYSFANENNIHVQPSTYNFNPVRKSSCDNCSYSRVSAERSAEFTLMCDECRYSDLQFIEQVEDIERKVDEAEKLNKTKKPVKMVKPCRAGRSSFWVSWDGKMMVCGMMNNPGYDLKTIDFSAAWDRIKEYSSSVTLPEKCSICKFRSVCDICVASCLTENGTTQEPPEYQCKRAEHFYNILIEATNRKKYE